MNPHAFCVAVFKQLRADFAQQISAQILSCRIKRQIKNLLFRNCRNPFAQLFVRFVQDDVMIPIFCEPIADFVFSRVKLHHHSVFQIFTLKSKIDAIKMPVQCLARNVDTKQPMRACEWNCDCASCFHKLYITRHYPNLQRKL